MTNSEGPPRLTRLRFHGPLNGVRAMRITGRLAEAKPEKILDLGCGWGALMLRILDKVPGAAGVGVDVNTEDLARGRREAEEMGVGDRVEFVEESAAGTTHGPADLVLCLGSSHALSDVEPPGHTAAALAVLRKLVTPGGRVLLGESFWERPPTDADLAAMWPGASAAEFGELADLVDLAVAAGFRVEWIETAGQDEWDDFESGYLADKEVWLAANPAHPKAAEVREQVDGHRRMYLRGYRGLFGLAYLTLVPVG